MEITGRIIKVLPIISGTGKNGEWRKQEFILQTEGQYPRNICFSMWGTTIDNNPISEGINVKVQFDLESREYNSKWYTDAKAWKIEKIEETLTNATSDDENTRDVLPDFSENETNNYDDLPF